MTDMTEHDSQRIGQVVLRC